MKAANDSVVSTHAYTLYNGQQARRGYAFNKMCHSLNKAENRRRFKAFPEAYCLKYGLSRAQIDAVTDLDVLRMLRLGGNVYYLQKLTRLYGLDLYDLCADQQAGALPHPDLPRVQNQ